MDVEVGDFEHEFVVEELYAVDVAGVGHDVAVADDVDVEAVDVDDDLHYF